MDLDEYISEGNKLEEIWLNSLEDQLEADEALQDYREVIGEYLDKELDRNSEDLNDSTGYRAVIDKYFSDNRSPKEIESDLKKAGLEVGRYELILDSRAQQLETAYESIPEEGFIWFEDDDYYSTDEVRDMLENKIERIETKREELYRQIRIVEEEDMIPYHPDSERRLIDNISERPEDALEETDWPRERFQFRV